jgi:hypothetical protein
MVHSGTLEQHQAQCDRRYVQWAWAAGILVTCAAGGLGLGWYAAVRVGDLEKGAALNARQMEVQSEQIDNLQARADVYDSVLVMLPRIESKLDAMRRWSAR